MPVESSADPLGDTADPRRYVPVSTDECALDALEASVRAGHSSTLLEGPGGVGKTLLLRVLAERALRGGHVVVFSPFLHVEPDDVARWLLHLIGRTAEACATCKAALLERPRAHGLLLIVDEIQSAPEGSVRRLAELAHAGGAQIVVGGTPGSALRSLLDSLGPQATVSLPDALPDREIEEICDDLIEHPALDPELRATLRAMRDALVNAAHGIPVSLKAELVRHALGFALGTPPPPAAWTEGPREEANSAAQEAPGAVTPLVAAEPGEPLAVEANGAALAARTDAPAAAVEARDAPEIEELDPAASRPRARRSSPIAAALARAPERLQRARASASGSARGAWASVSESAQRARASASESAQRARGSAARIAAHARAGGSALVERGRVARSAAAARSRSARVQLLASAGALAGRARRRAMAQGSATRWEVATCVALVSGALLALWMPEELAQRTAHRAAPAAVSSAAPAASRAGAAAPAPAPANAAAPARLQVQVNARPWAHVRVDGIDAGPTPLGHLHLAPGPHDFEATFPDGRVVRRRIEIGPEQRHVMLP